MNRDFNGWPERFEIFVDQLSEVTHSGWEILSMVSMKINIKYSWILDKLKNLTSFFLRNQTFMCFSGNF